MPTFTLTPRDPPGPSVDFQTDSAQEAIAFVRAGRCLEVHLFQNGDYVCTVRRPALHHRRFSVVEYSPRRAISWNEQASSTTWTQLGVDVCLLNLRVGTTLALAPVRIGWGLSKTLVKALCRPTPQLRRVPA